MWPQQSLIPVVMSGIIAVYALVIAVLIASDIGPPPGQNYSLFKYDYLGRIDSIANGFQWIHASCMRSIGRPDGTRGRLLDRNSRRYGCKVLHAAVEDFRWNGSDPDFWGGLGIIWVSTPKFFGSNGPTHKLDSSLH
jgi:hypothetical protein